MTPIYAVIWDGRRDGPHAGSLAVFLGEQPPAPRREAPPTAAPTTALGRARTERRALAARRLWWALRAAPRSVKQLATLSRMPRRTVTDWLGAALEAGFVERLDGIRSLGPSRGHPRPMFRRVDRLFVAPEHPALTGWTR